MSTYKDAKLWAVAFGVRLDQSKLGAAGMFRVMALEFKGDYVRALSGDISTAELRRAGHPFGRRVGGDGMSRMRGLQGTVAKGAGGRGRRGLIRRKYPLNPINRQTGRLVSSVKIRPRTDFRALVAYDVFADAPYAKFVLHPLGTARMVGRDVLTGHALGRQVPGRLERVWRAKQRVLRIKLAS